MRRVAFALILLTACSSKPTKSSQLAADCRELSMLGPEVCACLAQQSAEALSREEFSLVISLSMGTPKARTAAEAARGLLPPENEGRAMSVLLQAVAACATGARSGDVP